MSKTIIALFHPGEMGAAIGARLVAAHRRVVWASEGRSAATKARASAAGIEDLEFLERALEAADVVLSVCPPHGALELAGKVADLGFGGVYVDANAIAPETARQIGHLVEAAGAKFVDGGIIGPPPRPDGWCRLYLSGGPARDISALFTGISPHAIALDGPAGAASALKACYAAWTKGATALLACIRALAQDEGVDAALLEEWKLSQPDLPRRSEAAAAQARKAWRWVGEMEEIAQGFSAAGLPAGFHVAAAEVYRRLEGFKGGTTPPSLAAVTAAIGRANDC